LFNPNGIVRANSKNTSLTDESLLYRESNPLSFINKFFNSDFSKRFHAIGFNLMLGHCVEVLDQIINDIEIKIIYVYRENKLAQYASLVKSLETQRWATFNEEVAEKDKKHKVVFNPRKYLLKVRELETSDYLFRFFVLPKIKDRGVTVKYIDIPKLETAKKLCDFLGVEHTELSSVLKKQGNNIIVDRFENLNDPFVSNFINKVIPGEWLKEELE